MKIFAVTIQRDRARWLPEWLAFHHLQAIDGFVVYMHRCVDDTAQKIHALSAHFDIRAYKVPDEAFRPQLLAYQHAYQTHGHEADWFAFVDGDEFLFAPGAANLKAALCNYSYAKASAIGVNWACFGSGGHIKEPTGLVIENFTRRAPLDWIENRHIKSIVRGHQGTHFQTTDNAHFFKTVLGTIDELNRPVTRALSDYSPSSIHLRVNHYACQSREFYETFKRASGAADAGAGLVRSEEWWDRFDRNEEEDRFLADGSAPLKDLLDRIGLP